MRKMFSILLMLSLAMLLALPALAQGDAEPAVEVDAQAILDGHVSVRSTFSDGPGFLAIHIDNGEGGFGAVIGFRAVNPGWNFNVLVPIDASQATAQMFAMLHSDTGEVGVYEFGTVEGADGPVATDAGVVAPAFDSAIINASDQFVSGNTVTIDSVTVAEPAWVAVHADNGEGGFGAVIGSTLVDAGTTANVVVELDEAGITGTLWPMLHVDTGEAGVYEFGTVEGADGPIIVSGTVAVTPFWTVPHIRAEDQIILNGDNSPSMDMMDMAPAVAIDSVLSDGPGWVAIHSDNDGSPGPVLGFAAVEDGLTTDLTVMLDSDATAVLWPMLHTDTGTVGEYEFGTVEGADGPVRVGEQVVVFPIDVAPSLNMQDQAIVEAMMGVGPHIVIDSALVDGPGGWIAVHSSVDGAPGPVLGTAPLLHDSQLHGLNKHIIIELDPAAAGDQVFPMLHYDTGELGVYEFGAVEGADGPVVFGEAVVVAPLAILSE